jgi:hypothetical protein
MPTSWKARQCELQRKGVVLLLERAALRRTALLNSVATLVASAATEKKGRSTPAVVYDVSMG